MAQTDNFYKEMEFDEWINIASVAQSGTAPALRAGSRKGISVQIRALAFFSYYFMVHRSRI